MAEERGGPAGREQKILTLSLIFLSDFLQRTRNISLDYQDVAIVMTRSGLSRDENKIFINIGKIYFVCMNNLQSINRYKNRD